MSESISINQSDYNQRYDSLFKRYEAITSEIESLSTQLSESTSRAEGLRQFMAEVSSRDGILAEFDESLWYSTVDRVTVTSERELIFRYRNGDESSVEIV